MITLRWFLLEERKEVVEHRRHTMSTVKLVCIHSLLQCGPLKKHMHIDVDNGGEYEGSFVQYMDVLLAVQFGPPQVECPQLR